MRYLNRFLQRTAVHERSPDCNRSTCDYPRGFQLSRIQTYVTQKVPKQMQYHDLSLIQSPYWAMPTNLAYLESSGTFRPTEIATLSNLPFWVSEKPIQPSMISIPSDPRPRAPLLITSKCGIGKPFSMIYAIDRDSHLHSRHISLTHRPSCDTWLNTPPPPINSITKARSKQIPFPA